MLGTYKVVYLGLLPRDFSTRRFENLLKKSQSLKLEQRSDHIQKVQIGGWGEVGDDELERLVRQYGRDDVHLIFVTRHPIQNNWFTRSNYSLEGRRTGQTWVVATTYQLDEFCEKAGMRIEKALAGGLITSCFSADFVRGGGQYWSLWSHMPEKSPFGWCENKEEVLDGLDCDGIGERARASIRAQGYSNEQISLLEADCNRFRLGKFDKVRYWVRKNSAPVYFVLGCIVTVAATGISMQFA